MWFAIAVGSGLPWPGPRPGNQTDAIYWAGFVFVVFTQGHLFLAFFRSHANVGIFREHPLRFTLVPLAVFALGSFSARVSGRDEDGRTVWWDVYHSAMQTFGFSRIYDVPGGRRSGRGRPARPLAEPRDLHRAAALGARC